MDLVEKALKGAPTIRCTSVPGYKLEGGADIESTLRTEVNGCRILVALLTDTSIKSSYVIFELGARWGADLPLSSLRIGIEPRQLPGPLPNKFAPDATVRST